MTISPRLYLILGIVALLVSAELVVLSFAVHTLSAVLKIVIEGALAVELGGLLLAALVASGISKRVSEAASKEAQCALHVGSWEWDIHADKFTWSKEFLRLCDVSPATAQPGYADFVDLVHPGDRLDVDKAIQASCASCESFTVDY